jgi:hypothetical protein
VDRRTFLGAFAALSTQGVQPFGVNGQVTLSRYPYVQDTTATSSTILWATEESGTPTGEYSSDGRSFTRVTGTSQRFTREETRLLTPFYLHRVTFEGLTANTRYSYRVSLDGVYLAQGRFRTAGPGPFAFNLISDSGQGTASQTVVARRVAAESDSSFLIHAGDVAYFHGSHTDFQLNHFNICNFLLNSVPFFPVPGNHDYETEDARPYLSIHALPTASVPPQDAGRYYSFDWGDAHFVFLDSNIPLQQSVRGEGQMLAWLDNDLKQTRQPWRIATIHHSPYATGLNAGDPLSLLVRQHVCPILEANGVQVVFGGHEHSYQRTHPLRSGTAVAPNAGTVYITAGGGGAFLYPLVPGEHVAFGKSQHHYLRVEVTGSQLTVTAKGDDGSLIDNTVLRI